MEKVAKQSRTKKILLIVAAALLIVVATLLLSRCGAAKNTMQLDTEAFEGALPGLTAEEIQNRLDTIVEEGMFNVSMSTMVAIQDKIGEVRIENIPANRYWMKVDIVVTDSVGTQVPVYSSDLIKPGFSVEKAKFDVAPPEGMSDAVATFTAYDPNTQTEVGKTNMKIVLMNNITLEEVQGAKSQPGQNGE